MFSSSVHIIKTSPSMPTWESKIIILNVSNLIWTVLIEEHDQVTAQATIMHVRSCRFKFTSVHNKYSCFDTLSSSNIEENMKYDKRKCL